MAMSFKKYVQHRHDHVSTGGLFCHMVSGESREVDEILKKTVAGPIRSGLNTTRTSCSGNWDLTSRLESWPPYFSLCFLYSLFVFLSLKEYYFYVHSEGDKIADSHY